MKPKKKKPNAELFLTFLKIGAFTFGGGYAMIPLIQREASEKKKWIGDDELLDIIAVAESTPGPIAVNSATFVGFRTAGFFGALCATLGVVLPSFVFILLISAVLDEFGGLEPVRFAFSGIRAGVLALVIKALWGMGTKLKYDAFSVAVIIFAFAISVFTDVNLVFVILACALFGFFRSVLKERSVKRL